MNELMLNIFIGKKKGLLLQSQAGAEGVEPSSAVLETDVKPFNYAPIYGLHDQQTLLYIIKWRNVNTLNVNIQPSH